MARTTASVRLRFAAAALLLAAPLAACGEAEVSESSAEPTQSDETLAVALAQGDDFATISKAMNDTGLAQVFDGTAAYTILAPTDAAFAADEGGEAMPDDPASARPLLLARLREHVLPGALTPDDILAAIEAQKGSVTMATMGDGTLTFAADGDNIRVTDADGTSGTLAKAAIVASNGVAIPIDTVLHRP